jgi:hypothetical protein
MIEWIQNQNVFFAFVVVTVVAVLISITGTLVVNSIFTDDELIENNIIGGFKYSFLAEIVAALLGFAVVESATRFVSFQNRVDREIMAHTLVAEIERALGPTAADLRAARQAYIRSVVQHEWSAMQRDEPSPQTGAALKAWYQVAVNLSLSENRNEALMNAYFRNAGLVIENRIGRLGSAGSPFAGLVWASIWVALSITIVFNWFLGSRSLFAQVVMGGLLTTAVTMLAFLAVVLASPARSALGATVSDFAVLLQ